MYELLTVVVEEIRKKGGLIMIGRGVQPGDSVDSLGCWCPKFSWRPVSKLGTTKWVANFEPPIGQPRYQRKLDV